MMFFQVFKRIFLSVLLLMVWCHAGVEAATFATSDIEGTWRSYGLTSGGWEGWTRSVISIDSAGAFTANFSDSDGGSGSDSGTASLSSTGIFYVNGEANLSGIMSDDKNLIVCTNTDEGTYELDVIVKTGGTFATSDLTGDWYVFGLVGGSMVTMTLYGDATIDGSGNLSTTVYMPDGSPFPLGGTLAISSSGLISATAPEELAEADGVMSLDKNFVVLNLAMGGIPVIMILVKDSGTFTTSDLQGTWVYNWLVGSSGDGDGWERGTVNADSSGNFTVSSTSSDGSSGSDSGLLTIDGSGVVGVSGETAFHGAMSIDKNLMVSINSLSETDFAMGIFVMNNPETEDANDNDTNPYNSNLDGSGNTCFIQSILDMF